jgi:hypothetical protein
MFLCEREQNQLQENKILLCTLIEFYHDKNINLKYFHADSH